MAKVHSNYVCQQCGYSQVGWAGKCPNCGSWGSLVETFEEGKAQSKTKSVKRAKAVGLSKVPLADGKRVNTNIAELDRVLGGGLLKGQVVLVAGEPGIGKSTLLMQVADSIGETLYVSGEESVRQVAVRARRLGVKKTSIYLLDETDADAVIATAGEEARRLIVVDSIQTMQTSDLSGMAGSIGQVREVAYRLVRLAKRTNTPIFLVGHVTKEGGVAGPALLMHLVDTVLWFEGDKDLTIRLLRAVKNRFGPTDEVGIFSMEEKGLISVKDPNKLFVNRGAKPVAGSLAASIMQGTRPLMIEVQALVLPSHLAFPRRVVQGIDARRFELLLAVLAKQAGIPLGNYDCYLNLAGGISAKDPALDLSVCLALASSYFDKPLDKKLVAIGEVGLLGEVRKVVGEERRIKEAKRLGYTNVASFSNYRYIRDVIKAFLK